MNTDFVTKRVNNLFDNIKKYKYALLVLLLGVCLIVFPTNKKIRNQTEAEISPIIDLETKLKDILQNIHGAGDVDVMLTLKEGTRYVYQTDNRMRTDSSQQDDERTTVLISDGTGGETPIVSATIYPTYLGAVVVCEGADDVTVKLSIVNAVSDLTGLSSDKISIIKMKSN